MCVFSDRVNFLQQNNFRIFFFGKVLNLDFRNDYFYIEKWTFKVMYEVYYRAKRDKKEATCQFPDIEITIAQAYTFFTSVFELINRAYFL